jgi:hypothetical protein
MALYQGDRRLSRSEALESARIAVTQARQPLLRLPGVEMPGRVFFQVNDPGQGNRSGVLLEILRDRERSQGTQRFKIMSIGRSGAVGSNFIDVNAVLGGGFANFTGGLSVFATALAGGAAPTVDTWVDWAPSPSPSAGRMPYSMDANVANAATAEFGPPPSGARYCTVYSTATPPGAAGLAATWLDAAGNPVADWNGWATGGPQVAMAGYSLALTNNSGAGALVGVSWT